MNDDLESDSHDELASVVPPLESDAIVQHFTNLKAEKGSWLPIFHRRGAHEPPQNSDFVRGEDISDVQHESKATKVTLVVSGATVLVTVAGILYAIYHRRHKSGDKPGPSDD